LLRQLRRRKLIDKGFTLIELLVVITILGILAAIVVFSVQGIGDEGLVASATTDATILRTAEEAYCAQHGTYARQHTLASSGYISTTPSYNQVIAPLSTGSSSTGCGGTTYSIGTPTYTGPGTAPRILAASNATTPFSFMAGTFAGNHGSIQFTFGSSKS